MFTENSKLFKLANKAYYIYKRNNWMLDPSFFLADFDDVRIDRPIFLLGTQGGGLTLISRMLRRNEQVVSVTGDHRFWAGADEMQNVLEPILAPSLTGIKRKASESDIFGARREWVYATEQLLPDYRNTEQDATPECRQRFQKILKWVVKRHSHGKQGLRFIDKSQLYTVKASFIASLLETCDPKFILVTRDPYAMCYSRVNGTASLRNLDENFNFEQRLDFAAQHWANSMGCALEDKENLKNFIVVRFEDVLNNPEKHLKIICDHVELDFDKDMIPQPDHAIPFGSLRRDRWYPLRTEVNKRHLQKICPAHVEIIAQRVGKYADQFGYDKPNGRS